MDKNKPDFSGLVTRFGVLCKKDNRVITHSAFEKQDGDIVPLIYQHVHDDVKQVIGCIKLTLTHDGIRGDAYCADTEEGRHVKQLVKDRALNAFSIHAFDLKQTPLKMVNGEPMREVYDGIIDEVSVVLRGANPGAKIDPVSIAHGAYDDSDDIGEAWITGLETDLITLSHSDDEKVPDVSKQPTSAVDKTDDNPDSNNSGQLTTEKINKIMNSFDQEQIKFIKALIAVSIQRALEGDAPNDASNSIQKNQNDTNNDNTSNEGGEKMLKHAFDQQGDDTTLQHSFTVDEQLQMIKEAIQYDVPKFSDVVLQHAAEYGIEDVDIFFRDAHQLYDQPYIHDVDTGWVGKFLGAATHVPWMKLKSDYVDVTGEEARARGYIKGDLKEDFVVEAFQREVDGQMLVIKDEFDRETIIKARFDVIAFKKKMMKGKLDLLRAKAALLGDYDHTGRDKVKATKIVPIWLDPDKVYTTYVTLSGVNSNSSMADIAPVLTDATVVAQGEGFEGTGEPSFWTTQACISQLSLQKDLNKRRIYPNKSDLASAMQVKELIPVEPMKRVPYRVDEDGKKHKLIGILGNPVDYVFGTDDGGQQKFFDGFEIHFNKHEFLMEEMCSGMIKHPYSFIVFEVDVAEEAAS